MKRGNKSNRIARSNAFRESTSKKQSTYERDGFVFLFDDEELQKEYIHEYNHFNNLFVEKGKVKLPKPKKISYIDAKSLVSGKNQEKLTEIENVYKQLDYDWEQKGNMHKRHLFQEAVKDNDGSQEISHFIKSTQELFEELEEATKVDSIVNKKQVKYNVVYYVRQVG